MRKAPTDRYDDVELLRKIAKGNKQAFNQLFEKYWQVAYSEAYKRLKNEDDAKDVVQEIFAFVWINRQAQSIENFAAYLHVSIRNNVIKLLAKQSLVHPYFDLLENIPGANSTADSNLLWKEFFTSYEELLKTLPPKRQEVFYLRYHDGLSTQEISNRLNIKRKTVQNQLKKAVDTLKPSLLRLLIIISLLSVTFPV